MPTGKLICGYLAEHAPGVGLDRATRLWNKWNVNLATIISDENNIPEIARVLAPDRPNLAVRLAAAVVRVWKDSAAESNLVDWLMQRGVEDLKIARRAFSVTPLSRHWLQIRTSWYRWSRPGRNWMNSPAA